MQKRWTSPLPLVGEGAPQGRERGQNQVSLPQVGEGSVLALPTACHGICYIPSYRFLQARTHIVCGLVA
jgi:hypothetical protein